MNSKIFALAVTMVVLAISTPAQLVQSVRVGIAPIHRTAADQVQSDPDLSPEDLALARIKKRVANDKVNGHPVFQDFVPGVNYWTTPVQLKDDGTADVTMNITLPSTKGVILYVGSDMAWDPEAPRTLPTYFSADDDGLCLNSSFNVTSGGTGINYYDLYLYDPFGGYGMKLKDTTLTSVIVQMSLKGRVRPAPTMLNSTDLNSKPSGAQSGIVVVYALETSQTNEVKRYGFAGTWIWDQDSQGKVIIQITGNKAVLTLNIDNGINATGTLLGDKIALNPFTKPASDYDLVHPGNVFTRLEGVATLNEDKSTLTLSIVTTIIDVSGNDIGGTEKATFTKDGDTKTLIGKSYTLTYSRPSPTR